MRHDRRNHTSFPRIEMPVFRFFIHLITSGVLAALALLVASWTIPGVKLEVGGFIVAVAIFALAQGLLAPFVFNLARKYASAVLGGVGLVTAFLALFVATLFPGGLQIDGVVAWIAAPVVVWVVTALGGWLIGGLIVTRWLDKRDQTRADLRAVQRHDKKRGAATS